jgi:NAD(P)-dependent dehydrogenase (short-subunit alcohol dehydrogenase family)
MATPQAQKVLITAGAGGIGRAIAVAFAAAGARVHVCDLDAKALDHLRAEMPGMTTSVCDVGDRGSRAGGGARLQQVFQGRAAVSGRTLGDEQAAALADQWIKRIVALADIAALAVFLASDAGRSISGQLLPIDGDSQCAA